MRFAKIVFWCATVWGFVTLIPSYFLYASVGRQSPPPLTHPEFYYGFLAVALAWQVAFAVIATDPLRFRLMMLPAILEKFGYAATLAVLYVQNRLYPSQLVFGGMDALLGILFLIAFLTTGLAERRSRKSGPES